MTADAPARRSLYAEMADVLGPDVADAVVSEWGGTPLWVPRTVGPGHPIAAVLGAGAAARLAAWCGGGTLVVPIGAAQRRAERDRRIRDLARTVPAPVLARRYGLTVGRVYQILRAG